MCYVYGVYIILELCDTIKFVYHNTIFLKSRYTLGIDDLRDMAYKIVVSHSSTLYVAIL